MPTSSEYIWQMDSKGMMNYCSSDGMISEEELDISYGSEDIVDRIRKFEGDFVFDQKEFEVMGAQFCPARQDRKGTTYMG